MGFAFGHLRLAPAAFWGMTPRELAAAAHAIRGPARIALDRAGLVDLMARFPDAPGR